MVCRQATGFFLEFSEVVVAHVDSLDAQVIDHEFIADFAGNGKEHGDDAMEGDDAEQDPELG